MKEDLVSYKTARLAKEAGFGWPVNVFYARMLRNKAVMQRTLSNFNMEEEKVSVPTQCLLVKWLREEKQLSVKIYSIPESSFEYSWGYDVCDLSMKEDAMVLIHGENDKDYYNNFETGLRDALKYLKKNTKQTQL